MGKDAQPKRSKAARQAKQHLESLQSAGVEWLPGAKGAPAPTLFTPEPEATDQPAPAPIESPAPTPAPQSVPLVVLTPEQVRRELEVLKEKVAGCTRCANLAASRHHTVFGEGTSEADLCFIGEAPGQQEDMSGRPFVGDAGKLLDRIIVACGMKREEVYICNIIKCRPPGNRQPLPDESANCREYLERQMDLIRPKFICCLGATAAQNLLGTTVSIGKLRGYFQEYRGIPVLCTYHPAYLLRSPDKKKEVWEDMKKLLARMGKKVPGN